jgi:hypothetical protein
MVTLVRRAAPSSAEGRHALRWPHAHPFKRYLLAIVLAFVGLLAALFITSALHGMNQLARAEFVSQAASDAAGLRIEIDHLLIRVKDAANYVNSNAPDLAAQKLTGALNGSRYVPDEAIWRHDGCAIRAWGRRQHRRPRRDRQPGAIAAGQAGYALWWPIPTYPALFGRDRQDALVLVQACRAPRRPSDLCGLRLRQMCRDTAARSDFSNTYLIHIVGQQIDAGCSTQRTGGLGWLISGETSPTRADDAYGGARNAYRAAGAHAGAVMTTAIFGWSRSSPSPWRRLSRVAGSKQATTSCMRPSTPRRPLPPPRMSSWPI